LSGLRLGLVFLTQGKLTSLPALILQTKMLQMWRMQKLGASLSLFQFKTLHQPQFLVFAHVPMVVVSPTLCPLLQ
jgi:hypothetical protein